jgi:hypothetical protein
MKLTTLLSYLMMDVAITSVNGAMSECCPKDTGACSAGAQTYGMPMLDLSKGAYDRPTIDGLIGRDYSRFLELPMYNGGKNGGDKRIGTSYLAYDCAHNILCAAAHLDSNFLESNPGIQVEQDDGESWIRFGRHNGANKLKASNADEFRYIGKSDDPFFMVGWEGCWSVNSVRGMENVVNNYVEVHFSNDGDTTSTGKPASNGEYVCLTPECETTRPIITFPPVTSDPTKNPTQKPSSEPTVAPTKNPTKSPSLKPTVNPTQKPSSEPTVAPTKVSYDVDVDLL